MVEDLRKTRKRKWGEEFPHRRRRHHRRRWIEGKERLEDLVEKRPEIREGGGFGWGCVLIDKEKNRRDEC